MGFTSMPSNNTTGGGKKATKSTAMTNGALSALVGTRSNTPKIVPGSAATGAMPKPDQTRTKLPTANTPRSSSHVSNVLGTKKHGKGNVPGYLKNS